MESVNKLGDIYIKGELINLKSTPIKTLNDKIAEIELEEKNLKNEIFAILESF
ncbi:MAG: hypothetical protein ACI4UE_03740 [Candidatus Scatovivens sp.]